MIRFVKYLILSLLLISASISNAADTLRLSWQDEMVTIAPRKLKGISYQIDSLAYVTINVNRRKPVVFALTGSTHNGGLRLIAQTECNLLLNSVNITSLQGPALELNSKFPIRMLLNRNSDNVLQDSSADKKTNHGVAACIHSAGPLVVEGDGVLHVLANKRHGITVDSTFILKEGLLDLHISRKGAKGINCGRFEMLGGRLTGEGTSDIIYKDSILTYSSLVKSQGNMTITAGNITLSNSGLGSRCLTCGDTLFLKGGKVSLEANGDGGYFSHRERGKHYWNVRDYRQYYSSRCLKAKVCYLEQGQLSCLSTGTGGKGIDVDDYLQTGIATDSSACQGPEITIETRGNCIYNDTIFDQRDGCPKSIRARNINMYSGTFDIQTFAMGGEGVECDSLVIWHPRLICNTFDDGINVLQDVQIHGGEVYCNSRDNDGIDSNGSLHISGGIVASISQNYQNESLDAENNQVVITGGTIFGIGNSTVKMQSTTMPIYNAVSTKEGRLRPTLNIQADNYLCIVQNDTVLMALRNTDTSDHASVIALCPAFRQGGEYQLVSSSRPPVSYHTTYFYGNLLIGGYLDNTSNLNLLEQFVARPWIFREMRGKNKLKGDNK